MVEQNTYMKLEKYAQEYANDPEFIAEGLSIKIIEEMLECLKNRGLKHSWLAEQMGVSRAHISKILNAPSNMTLLTMAKIAVALGVTIDICLNPETKESNVELSSELIDLDLLSNGYPVFIEAKTGSTIVGATSGMNRGITYVGAISGTNRGITYIATNTGEFVTLAAAPSKTQKPSEEPELVLAA
jgi:transcriptional regulator with XRE-family HTH domain